MFLLSYRISVAKRRGKITNVLKTGKLTPLLGGGLNKKSVARNRGSLQRSLELIDEKSLRNEVQSDFAGYQYGHNIKNIAVEV